MLRPVRPRVDLLTASRIDLALILLPLIGRLEVARMLARGGVPVGLAVRVMTTHARRWNDARI